MFSTMFKNIVLFLFVSNICFLEVKSSIPSNLDARNAVFDPSFYEDALDSELCSEELEYLRENTVAALPFYSAGLRIPRSIINGNFLDLGNYLQCLAIDENTGTSVIKGKFCSINVPLDQDLQIPELPSNSIIEFNPALLKADDTTMAKVNFSRQFESSVHALIGYSRTGPVGEVLGSLQFTLAACVPKTCTVKQALDSMYFNVSDIGFEFEENYCRLEGDKPWVPADYVAVSIFSIIGLITALSTTYDVWNTVVWKKNAKELSTLGRSFSVYNNARRLTTFTTHPGALECVDGIRALSMIWIILGHTYGTYPPQINPLDVYNLMLSYKTTWLTAAPICVDSFFFLSGMLVVYTTAGKFNGVKLLKSLHLFYLNRLLRMFPLLAALVLTQASFLYRLSDGPFYQVPADATENCRTYWWTTLLYVQNYVNPKAMCLPHSWYLAIDMHMYIIAPLILFWVLSDNKVAAWIALAVANIAFLTASTVYIFIKEFPSGVIRARPVEDPMYYLVHYYFNTLTRGSPFLIGMIFGYILHIWRGKKLNLSKFMMVALWVCCFILLSQGLYSSHPPKSVEWDNQTLDSLINSFTSPLWAAGVGLLIFICVKGYGGPINWLLSLQLWKLLSRISFAMYLYHYQIMFVTGASAMQPVFFSISRGMFRFLSELLLTIIVSFVVTVTIDSPFSILVKLAFGGGPKKPDEPKQNGITNARDISEENLTREKRLTML